jgi:hypothetical protein
LEFIVTVQPPVPVHAPDRPANAEPAAGVAVSVTDAPEAKLRQPVPHQVPAEEEPTVPLPVPDVVIGVFVGGPAIGYGFYAPYWGPAYYAPYDNTGAVKIDSK